MDHTAQRRAAAATTNGLVTLPISISQDATPCHERKETTRLLPATVGPIPVETTRTDLPHVPFDTFNDTHSYNQSTVSPEYILRQRLDHYTDTTIAVDLTCTTDMLPSAISFLIEGKPT